MPMTLCLDDRSIEDALSAVLSTQLDEVSVQVRGEPGIGWDERVHRIRTGSACGWRTLPAR